LLLLLLVAGLLLLLLLGLGAVGEASRVGGWVGNRP
jgi:hypothetical protein